MKPITREWIDKAEGDYVVAQREVRARKSPNYDAVCFHAQESVDSGEERSGDWSVSLSVCRSSRLRAHRIQVSWT